MTIETLTDVQRSLLIAGGHQTALRIIDAHAADRAALVALIDELTRERDEARTDYKQAAEAYKQACAELNDTESEVTRLQSALAAAEYAHTRATASADEEYTLRKAAESRVRELEARIEKALAELQSSPLYSAKTRCKEALRGP